MTVSDMRTILEGDSDRRVGIFVVELGNSKVSLFHEP